MNDSARPDLDGTAEERIADTPDGSIRVRILGRGPVVLCLHGVSAQGRSWLAVARRLAHRATFIVPDLIGRGASAPAPALAFDLTSETRRIGDLLEALGDAHPTGPGGAGPVVPAVIAGHSQGAAIALSWAADAASPPALLLSNPVTPWTRRPLALGALESGLMRALIAGIFSPLRRPLAAAILRRAAGPEYRVPPDVIDAYAAPYADRARAATLMAVLRDWHPAQLEGRLPVAGPPAHVLAGSRDPRIAPDTARRLAERLGAGFTLVGDGGHVLPEQHPRLLAEELERILDVLGTAPVTGR